MEQPIPEAIAAEFKRLEKKLADQHSESQARLKRIENQTRFARNVQDVSKATQVLYRVAACVLSRLLKACIAMVIVYISLYMVFHDGNAPSWAHTWLSFARHD